MVKVYVSGASSDARPRFSFLGDRLIMIQIRAKVERTHISMIEQSHLIPRRAARLGAALRSASCFCLLP